MKEGAFQQKVKQAIKDRLPGSMVLKNDPNYIQGIPDLLILFGTKWAALELKRSKDAPHRPNQKYYVEKMNDMSFASFISPENMEGVLNELEQSLKGRS